jgi:hypothetical protein
MNLVVGSWFGEPEIEFKISHKVYNFIREKIIEDILKHRGLYNEKDKDFIGIQITTNKETVKPFLSEPSFDKKNNFTNYNFWLPHQLIVNSDNELKSFLNYFFIVLTDFLKIYNIPFKEVEKLRLKIEFEIIDNVEYIYEIDESLDFDIDELTKDLGIE